MNFWNWLNASQHATALQAIFAGLGWLAAIMAAIYARGAYLAALRQLTLAQAQHANANLPHLKVIVPSPAGIERYAEVEFLKVIVRNVGSGLAVQIEGSDGIMARATTLPANAEFYSTLQLTNKHLLGKRSQTAFLRYSSLDNRRFRTEVTIVNGALYHEAFADITSGTEPASFEEVLRPRSDAQAVSSDRQA